MDHSPLARCLRLGREMERLRQEQGLSQEALAKQCGFGRLRISSIETAARKPDVGDVLKALEVLGVPDSSDKWRELLKVAQDAREQGWYDRRPHNRMGERQRRWANLEHSADLRMYDPFLVPGLLQTEDYYRELNEAAADLEDFDAEVELAGRMERQRQFHAGRGTLDVVIEEIVVRHLFVTISTMQGQLRYLADVADSERISVRVIPTQASLQGAQPPRSPFVLLKYLDPGDPEVVLLEGVEGDGIHTGKPVEPYARSFDRMSAAALSPADSVSYFAKAAEDLGAA